MANNVLSISDAAMMIRMIESGRKFFMEDDKSVPFKGFIRLLGIICLFCSLIELGIGLGVAGYLSNVSNGAWWSAICIILAGICAIISKDRHWVIATCVLSSFGFLTSLVGAIHDGLSSATFRTLTSCGRIPNSSNMNQLSSDFNSYTNNMIFFGSPKDKTDVGYCMTTYGFVNKFKFDTCYCVSEGGGFCGAYILSKNARNTLKQNCGDIMTTFTPTLTVSVVLCSISAVFTLLLFILNSISLYRAEPSTEKVEKEDGVIQKPEKSLEILSGSESLVIVVDGV